MTTTIKRIKGWASTLGIVFAALAIFAAFLLLFILFWATVVGAVLWLLRLAGLY